MGKLTKYIHIPSLEEWIEILKESANTFFDDIVRLFEWLSKKF